MTDDSLNYNYGVLKGGVYETRHDAVGAAAILNREMPFDFHQVHVLPNVIGATEILATEFTITLPQSHSDQEDAE